MLHSIESPIFMLDVVHKASTMIKNRETLRRIGLQSDYLF